MIIGIERRDMKWKTRDERHGWEESKDVHNYLTSTSKIKGELCPYEKCRTRLKWA